MDCVNNVSFYFREEELLFLLSGLGISELYGLFSEETGDMWERTNMHRIVAGLYQKKVIRLEQNRITVLPPFSELLDVIEKSRRCITLKRSSIECMVRCCYMTSSDAAVMEKSQREPFTVRLYQMSVEEWMQFVLSEVEKEDRKMQFEFFGRSENICYEKIMFLENGIQNVLVYEKGKKQIQIEYQKEKLVEKLEEWIGGCK